VLGSVLAVLGYSLNDDRRLRPHSRQFSARGAARSGRDSSVNQTLGPLVTGVTGLLVLMALLFLGGETLWGFSVALIIGIVVGVLLDLRGERDGAAEREPRGPGRARPRRSTSCPDRVAGTSAMRAQSAHLASNAAPPSRIPRGRAPQPQTASRTRDLRRDATQYRTIFGAPGASTVVFVVTAGAGSRA
jgi:hypothetical protein